MLDLNFIEKYARENHLPLNRRRLITEYFQTIILEIIANSKFNESIIFMGDTCLRLIYNIQRFSEDLDFDLNLKKRRFNFNEFCKVLQRELRLQSFIVDIKKEENSFLFRASVKFSEVLFLANLSPLKNEKLTINIEIDKNPSKYLTTETKIISHFNKTFPILINDKATLFAEKIKAVLLRKYCKARDYFDLVFFLSDPKNKPNFAVLKEKKLGIKDMDDLNKVLKRKIQKITIDEVIKDLKPYIFYPQQLNLVKKFLESYKNKP